MTMDPVINMVNEHYNYVIYGKIMLVIATKKNSKIVENGFKVSNIGKILQWDDHGPRDQHDQGSIQLCHLWDDRDGH